MQHPQPEWFQDSACPSETLPPVSPLGKVPLVPTLLLSAEGSMLWTVLYCRRHKTLSSHSFLLNSAFTRKALWNTTSLWQSSDAIIFDLLRIGERNRNELYFLIQCQKAFSYTKSCPTLHWIPPPVHKIMCETCTASRIEAIEFYRCSKFIYNHPEMTRKELQAAVNYPSTHYHFRTKEKWK